nr:MAG TPA: hypothetical protein [Bacteriophage sp.]
MGNLTKKAKMRLAFGITDLVIGVMFLALILTSKGGIENNSRMMCVSWLLVWAGGLGVLGTKKKGFTIAAIVFYVLGILYNLVCTMLYPAHIIIAAMLIIFLVLICISLSDKESFAR